MISLLSLSSSESLYNGDSVVIYLLCADRARRKCRRLSSSVVDVENVKWKLYKLVDVQAGQLLPSVSCTCTRQKSCVVFADFFHHSDVSADLVGENTSRVSLHTS